MAPGTELFITTIAYFNQWCEAHQGNAYVLFIAAVFLSLFFRFIAAWLLRKCSNCDTLDEVDEEVSLDSKKLTVIPSRIARSAIINVGSALKIKDVYHSIKTMPANVSAMLDIIVIWTKLPHKNLCRVKFALGSSDRIYVANIYAKGEIRIKTFISVHDPDDDHVFSALDTMIKLVHTYNNRNQMRNLSECSNNQIVVTYNYRDNHRTKEYLRLKKILQSKPMGTLELFKILKTSVTKCKNYWQLVCRQKNDYSHNLATDISSVTYRIYPTKIHMILASKEYLKWKGTECQVYMAAGQLYAALLSEM